VITHEKVWAILPDEVKHVINRMAHNDFPECMYISVSPDMDGTAITSWDDIAWLDVDTWKSEYDETSSELIKARLPNEIYLLYKVQDKMPKLIQYIEDLS
jgi:hypothetical protein